MNHYLIVDGLEGEVLEVEFDDGLRTELPATWFPPGVEEGDGFRVELQEGGVRFIPDERAVRIVRERNKQTLLDFSDDLE